MLKFINMVSGKVYRPNLSKEYSSIYDSVKKLRHGELLGFTMNNKSKTEYFSWKIYSDFRNGIETVTFYGNAVYIDKSYSYIFVPEYDSYQSKLSNFDYMLIYVFNWYDN